MFSASPGSGGGVLSGFQPLHLVVCTYCQQGSSVSHPTPPPVPVSTQKTCYHAFSNVFESTLLRYDSYAVNLIHTCTGQGQSGSEYTICVHFCYPESPLLSLCLWLQPWWHEGLACSRLTEVELATFSLTQGLWIPPCNSTRAYSFCLLSRFPKTRTIPTLPQKGRRDRYK